ncbi:DUF4262 domain-containing protein [Terrabacter sp. MAHUQ-38]|nr:DUF4262 domain-containing protein [Terrabacter sp. MAHUQ-38]
MDTAATHWLDQQDRVARKMIREYGCFLQYVSGGHGASRGTPFCYTTELFGLGQPELLVFGLDQLSQRVCSTTSLRWSATGASWCRARSSSLPVTTSATSSRRCPTRGRSSSPPTGTTPGPS